MSNMIIKFSKNLRSLIFCNVHTNTITYLKREENGAEAGKNIEVNHLKGKVVRKIFWYGEDDFAIVHSKDQDRFIKISHSLDATKKIKVA